MSNLDGASVRQYGPGLGQRASRFLDRAKGLATEYDLGPYQTLVRQMRATDLSGEADAGLGLRARELRARLSAGEETEGGLVEAFALAAEAMRRRLGLEPYDEQMIAGVAMYRGKLAEMQTGEGKTMAAVFTACLHALAGRRMHVMTANDYLARRDAAWMGPVYAALGLRAAAIGERTEASLRRDAYGADVLYVTAREAGFDHLRDQLCWDASETVQGSLEAALVDEADFLLIDEARIPLVLAGASDCDGLDVGKVDRMVRTFRPGAEYGVDPEGRRVWILPEGHARVERELGVEGIHEERGALWFARVHAALHARALLRRDVDYVVKGDRAELVDEFTGRVADRRRWPYGIQAALEAKEGLPVRPEGRVYGSINIQDYVGQYERIAAMTATAVPSAAELYGTYGLATVVIPPVKPVRRADHPDTVFRTREAKMRAVTREIAAAHETGRPVLVGTASVRESEELAGILTRGGIRCEVLNARNDEREAELIAHAGRLGAVTISTNMAGRGTDIKLAGPDAAPAAVPDAARKAEYGRLLDLGGLYVIGTNRHESRRVDNQLRGRSGRQGEPGASRFFISLEDPLFTRHGVRAFLPRDREPESVEPIRDPRFLREIDRAQSVIERQNHDIRRTLRKFSQIVELDRRYVRQLRMEALREGRLPPAIEAAEIRDGHRKLMVRAFLGRLDEFWAEHLRTVEDIKEGIGLVRYAGKEPGIVFLNRMATAFETGLRGVEESVIGSYAAVREGTEAAVSDLAMAAALESMGVKRPSSTWTYTVDDAERASFNVSAIADSNIGAAAAGAMAYGPLFLATAAADAARGFLGAVRSRLRGGGRRDGP